MALSVSDDSEYSSDISRDSLNSATTDRLEESETVRSAGNFPVSECCVNGCFETQAMETDGPGTWYDLAETCPRTAGNCNEDADDYDALGLSPPSADARIGGRELSDIANEELPRIFSKLVLENRDVRTARSDEGHCRRTSKYIRVGRSFSCLRNMPRQRSKSALPASDPKHISYLELYRRKKFGAQAAVRQPIVSQKEDDMKDLRDSCKEIAEEEAQLRGHEYPSNTPVSSGTDIRIVDELQTILHTDVLEPKKNHEISPTNCFSTEQKFTQAACSFTEKGFKPLQLQNKNLVTKIGSKLSHFQVPPKLGSLGRDIEAVKEKYERLMKQQNYGKQASIRNRVKMSQSRRICCKATEEKHVVHARTPKGPSSDTVRVSKCQMLEKKSTGSIGFKSKVSSVSRRKDSNQINRAREIPFRCEESSLRNKTSKTVDTIAPLVERHIKENEIVESIRRSFRESPLSP